MLAQTEHEEQCAVIQWARANDGREPRLSLLFSIPNGAKLPWTRSRNGVRYSPEANRLVAEGMRKGIPDLMLAVPVDGYHGLFIEMKSLVGKQSEEQKQVASGLREQGYRVEVCYGAEAAIAVLEEYLQMERQLCLRQSS